MGVICKTCGMEFAQLPEKMECFICVNIRNVWGELVIKYKPTGEIKRFKLGIRRMDYNNELIFCASFGYDIDGSQTPLNDPDNWEVISVQAKEDK